MTEPDEQKTTRIFPEVGHKTPAQVFLASACLSQLAKHTAAKPAESMEATNIHPSCQAQIASLKLITILTKYLDYTVFFPSSARELPEHTGINNHPINLVDDKGPTLLVEVPVPSKGDLPNFIDVSSKASARLPLHSP